MYGMTFVSVFSAAMLLDYVMIYNFGFLNTALIHMICLIVTLVVILKRPEFTN